MHVNIAWPVSPTFFVSVAVIVTALASATVHVAVTCVFGEAESCTDGSLAVQFELAGVTVVFPQGDDVACAMKTWALPGDAAA